MTTNPAGPAPDPVAELDRQVETLVRKGYPRLVGITESDFRAALEGLRNRLPAGAAAETIPFVVVVPERLVPIQRAVAALDLDGRDGFTDMTGDDLGTFGPIDGLEPPEAPYLVTDVDAGGALLDVPPDAALPRILAAGRSPLTLAEGVAVVTQHPRVLREENCFSMLGSRCGDRRVPALWLSRRRPRLGWCWAGNPHSWLGSASCRARLA